MKLSYVAFMILLGCATESTMGSGGEGSSDTAGESAGASTASDGASQDDSPSGGSGSPTTSADSTDTGAPQDDGPEDESTSEGASESTGIDVQPGPDFRLAGPYATQETGGTASLGACTMPYDSFAPSGVADAPVVVLAHGMQGNRASMRGWAEHWASWGVRVVTPNLCHATIFDADHAANGAELVALSASLELDTPIYAGYSAGALAALIAASQDPDALALVALDLVDANSLGAQAAASVTVPTHDIVAEAAMCNSTANGVPVVSTIADSAIVRLFEADHCDFQNPPDSFCNLCASPNDTQAPESIRAAIFGLSTAAVLWRAGVDDTGAQWWSAGGPYYDAMVLDGTLAQL